MSFVDSNRESVESIYGDIINLPHPEPKKHPRMSRENRGAQFAPFAALTGYDDAVSETARLTGDRIEISEEKKTKINRMISILLGESSEERKPEMIIYFLPDKYKQGGSYVSSSASIKKYDSSTNTLHTVDGVIIPVDDIFDIR